MRGASLLHKACIRNLTTFSIHSYPIRLALVLPTYTCRIVQSFSNHRKSIQPRLQASPYLVSRLASYSYTDTGDKPADPCKAKILQEPELKMKVEDLVSFMEHCQFGMMTTRIASSGLPTSRCMALAAKVRPFPMKRPFCAGTSKEKG